MSAEVEIRFVGPEAAETVRAISLAAYEEYRETLIPPPGIFLELIADTATSIAEGGAVIAHLDGTQVGTARFRPRDDYIYIGRVAVLPEFRRRGIATAMMEAIKKQARLLGFTLSQVEVRLSLPENLAVYGAARYFEVGRYSHARVPTATTVHLAKKLV